MTTFSISIFINLGGCEEEFDALVVGTFHRAERAFTPRGEMAPIDPPHAASFEIDHVELKKGIHTLDLMPWLSGEQFRAIEEQGIEEAGNDYEAGREAAAEARAEAIREDMRDRYLAEFGE